MMKPRIPKPTSGHLKVEILIRPLDTSIEGAEDDKNLAVKDVKKYKINKTDTVIGITSSGTTP